MTATLQCISPIDGAVFAERPAASPDQASAAVARARVAQTAWAARPLAERVALVRAGIAALEASEGIVRGTAASAATFNGGFGMVPTKALMGAAGAFAASTSSR